MKPIDYDALFENKELSAALTESIDDDLNN